MMIHKNILLVDSNITNIDILIKLLGDKYDLFVSLNGKDALNIVQTNHIDLILLDIMMPHINGYEVCNTLKLDDRTKDIPIIFITARNDEDSIEKAYDAGGIDYITKPFKPKELLARVQTVITLQNLIHELKEQHEELKLLASTDPMTGLYNRRYFHKTSEPLIDLAKRDKTETSIILIDIDKFKNINDTYGHQVGDNIIISLGKQLENFTRKSDIICRFGGEEFIILLPKTSIDGAAIISEKIRENIQNNIVYLDDNKKLSFTISIGVSKVNNDKDEDIDIAIHRADKALYEAKNSGRNKVIVNNEKEV